MTIDEAIKILTTWKEEGESGDSLLLDEAENLAIEALKHIKETRGGSPIAYSYIKLPGETE